MQAVLCIWDAEQLHGTAAVLFLQVSILGRRTAAPHPASQPGILEANGQLSHCHHPIKTKLYCSFIVQFRVAPWTPASTSWGGPIAFLNTLTPYTISHHLLSFDEKLLIPVSGSAVL